MTGCEGRLVTRQHEDMQTRGHWILLPENRAARQAVERVRDCVCERGPRRLINPLVLHAPPGTGKSHLVNDLVAEVTRPLPDSVVALVPAAELADGPGAQQDLRRAALVVVEDPAP